MAAVIKDIFVDQGTTHVERFMLETLEDPLLPYDAASNPYVPLNISAAEIYMQVRTNYDATATALDASTANSKIFKVGEGLFELRLSPSDTTNIRFTGEELSCVYDIELHFSGMVLRPIMGSFVISREVTR